MKTTEHTVNKEEKNTVQQLEADNHLLPTLALPEGETEPWRIDEPHFKATAFRETIVRGRPAWMSECFEFEGGKWEGFVSITFEEEINEQQD